MITRTIPHHPAPGRAAAVAALTLAVLGGLAAQPGGAGTDAPTTPHPDQGDKPPSAQ